MAIVHILERHHDTQALQAFIEAIPTLKNLGYQAIALEGFPVGIDPDTLLTRAQHDIMTTRVLLLEDFPQHRDEINCFFPEKPKKLQRIESNHPILLRTKNEHTTILCIVRQWLRDAIDDLDKTIAQPVIEERLHELQSIVTRSLSNHVHLVIAKALQQYHFTILPIEPANYVELHKSNQNHAREEFMSERIKSYQKQYPNLLVKTGSFHYPVTPNAPSTLKLFLHSSRDIAHDMEELDERPDILKLEQINVENNFRAPGSKNSVLTTRIKVHHACLIPHCNYRMNLPGADLIPHYPIEPMIPYALTMVGFFRPEAPVTTASPTATPNT